MTYQLRSDNRDWRDFAYTPTGAQISETVDLRKYASPVEEQGHLGSCVANAVVGAYELLLNKEYPAQFINLSRLFIYYNARLLENNVNDDVGIYVRDGIKSVKTYGVCNEILWPYNIDDFAKRPSSEAYDDAMHRNIKNYYRLVGIHDILDALNSGKPVIFGMKVYNVFDKLQEYGCVLSSPSKDEEPIGGHAMCLVGYDLQNKLVLARNSFGEHWCIHGYCWITFDYIETETLDSWIFDIDLIKEN